MMKDPVIIEQAIDLATDCLHLELEAVRARVGPLPEPKRAAVLRYFGESAAWRAWKDYRQQLARLDGNVNSRIREQVNDKMKAEDRREVQRQARSSFMQIVSSKEKWPAMWLPALKELVEALET